MAARKKSSRKDVFLSGRKKFIQRLKTKHLFAIILSRRLLAITIIAALFLAIYVFKDLPSPTRLSSFPYPSSTQIFDRNGGLLYEIYAEKDRTPISLSDLPDYIINATVASEDKDFYTHHGFDFRGIFRAVYNTVLRKSLQGGSTITQQLVKTALLTPERTIRRKIREALLTWATEVIYKKDQILEMYLNQVPYGGTAWGIEAAAKTYFNKHAKDVTLAEAALLVGLPASPTRFSPYGAHPELAKSRQERVLQMMVENGYLTEEQASAAKNEPLKFTPPKNFSKAPHFSLYIKELLTDRFGQTLVEQDGLKVYTTLDVDIQENAQKIVFDELEKIKKLKVANGAALVTNPKTGEILAMVGSKDYFNDDIDGKVNVVLSSRQPGSSIKPINYALAIEKHLITPATVINDVPTCFNVSGQKIYCPENYDGQFHGPTQVRFALGNSFNVPAVKVLAMNGLENFVKFANEMGINSLQDPKNYGLSLTLGGGEVTMYEMATAFSAFANLGIRQDLWAIKKVEDSKKKVLFENIVEEGPRILSMETAYLISHILLDNNARSAVFGPSSYLNVRNHPEVSVKTGTTNDRRDNWTIGYNPSILTAVWVGNNDNTPMSYVASGVTGASPVWNKIIGFALEKADKEAKKVVQSWPTKPDDIVGEMICTTSGLKINPAAPCSERFEYFIQNTAPKDTENLKVFIEVDKNTNQIANSKTLPENKELREKSAVYDPLKIPFCLDCPAQTEPFIIRYPLEFEINPISPVSTPTL